MSSRPLLFIFILLAANLRADPLTKQLDIDFGRDVPSRNLKGLATRSDGRILPGPVFTDLTGPKLGNILWTLKPAGPNRFIVGTGPEGKVQEVTFNPKDSSYTVREIADVAETQAIAILPLPDGGLLVGTSPTGALYLVKDGKTVTRVPLPADSVFDLLALPDGIVLAATGNPGKIYHIDLKEFATAGVIEGKIDNDALLADRGVRLFGEIRDRNVRKLARLTDGRIIAGSAPKGNVYSFGIPAALAAGTPAKPVAPVFLQENRDAEVVDLLPLEDGGFYAGIVFSAGDIFRLAKPSLDVKDDAKEMAKDALFKERDPKPGFAGRSAVVRFPADGFPESLVNKTGVSLYRLGRYNDWLLLTAGEQGDVFGYDPVARRSLTFAGSASAQLSDVAPLGGGRYLILRNNSPGLALMAFTDAPVRELETKRLDLGQSGELGAFRFPRLRGVTLEALKLEASTNFGSDELEGWSPWTELKQRDHAFQAEDLRARYVRYRLTVPGKATDFVIDKATQYYAPQNRRPVLGDFRVFQPNQGLVPAGEQPGNVVATVAQLLFPKDDAPEKRKGSFLNSQVIPQPGTQIIYWSMSDMDGDTLAYTFSIRHEGSETWTDLSVNSNDNYVQFETGGLAEGLYFTRLIVAEQAPRPAGQRLSYTFETDSLVVDHSDPVITATDIKRNNGRLLVSVSGRDALSLLEGLEVVLNNGTREIVLHPVDGLLDGREESFTAEFPEAKVSGASSVEVILYDQAGNAASVRLPVK